MFQKKTKSRVLAFLQPGKRGESGGWGGRVVGSHPTYPLNLTKIYNSSV